jgi:hypothetical protein
MSQVKEFIDLEIDDVHEWDAPDYADAFICSATAVLEDGTTRDATDDELDELNKDSDLVYAQVIRRLY